MIYESIITSLNADGSTHIAPMGVHTDGDLYVIAPFKPSTTLENLRRTGEAVINFTDDVRVFAGCLTGRSDWPVRSAAVVKVGVLEAALAHVEVQVSRTEEDEQRPKFFCAPRHSETRAPFRGFNRAQAAVLEAAILVSRLHMLPAARVDREVEYLKIAVDKTAGENERIAWSWLMERIEAFRRDKQPEALPR